MSIDECANLLVLLVQLVFGSFLDIWGNAEWPRLVWTTPVHCVGLLHEFYARSPQLLVRYNLVNAVHRHL